MSQLIKSAQAGVQVIIDDRVALVAQLIPIIPIHAKTPALDRNFLKWLASQPAARARPTSREGD